MIYPFLKLDDNTEIVHSELLPNDQIKFYIEKPVNGGFYSAICYLPSYQWSEIDGFTNDDINYFKEILESTTLFTPEEHTEHMLALEEDEWYE